MRLPAGAADVAVTTDLEFCRTPLCGDSFRTRTCAARRWDYKLVLPNGEMRSILSVPRYDFNWQTYYMFTAAAAGAERIEDRLDRLVRQLGSE